MIPSVCTDENTPSLSARAAELEKAYREAAKNQNFRVTPDGRVSQRAAAVLLCVNERFFRDARSRGSDCPPTVRITHSGCAYSVSLRDLAFWIAERESR